MNSPIDFLVETGNPAALDQTLQQMGQDTTKTPPTYIKVEDYHVMRALKNPDFLEFACRAQGYCKIIRRLDHLL